MPGGPVILAAVSARHPYLEPLAPGRPLAFAHRGGAGEGDENTLAAFARAVALGYRHLETDVRTTADGVAVVFHDATTDRMLGRAGRVADLSWQDLSTVRRNGATVVPRLDDLLDAWPSAYLNIDVKSPDGVVPTIKAVQRTASWDRVLLASFHDATLRLVRAADARVATSLGRAGCVRVWAASRLGTGGRGAARRSVAAQVPVAAVDARFIRHAQRLGLAVHVWTVNDARTMRDLLDAGVDGIMTDHLDVLRDVYAERGAWPA
ncbi:MAG TPA: glycerophosphodiester phosphodiesterase family protein [Micromonosporaceae bacterium]